VIEIMWRATVLTLFPEMFPGPLGVSLAGRALASGLWALEARDIRDSATDRHRSVDDTPAGGGPGMVLRADVLAAAIDATASSQDRPRLLMSPRGRPLTQSRVMELAAGPGPLVVCGRFEGVDQRVIEARSLEEISVGDYVLSGGEIAAMALLDACVRLLPGVMGKLESGSDESFSNGLLEYPQYTRRSSSRASRSRTPDFRRSCQGRRLAAGRGGGPDKAPAAGFVGGTGKGPPKTPKKHDGWVTTLRLCRIAAPNPRTSIFRQSGIRFAVRKCSNSLIARILFAKPVSTFAEYALQDRWTYALGRA